jgi:hypothetical protein
LRLTAIRQLEREGKEEKGHRHWQNEDIEARCTQILERIPNRRTEGSQRAQQVMRWSSSCGEALTLQKAWSDTEALPDGLVELRLLRTNADQCLPM